MASYLLVVVVFLSIFEKSILAEVTFKNVTVREGFQKIVFITSSTTLKNNLPSDSINGISISGKIPVLYEDSVSDINNIKQLTFYRNGMLEVRPGAFRNLSNVTTVKIVLNKNLTALQKHVFYNLSVEDLVITDNLISTIEAEAFQNLPKLSSLTLKQNKLETIDEDAFKDLVNLKSLDLSSNRIVAIPRKIFKNMPNLKELSLLQNKLKEIQEETFMNSSIESLDLSWNLLLSLPKKCFENMPHLASLRLTHNNIENIPAGIFNNLALAVLKLDFNNISVIAPNAFDNMPNLEHILLSGNKISKYNPDWFHNTRNIYRLYLQHNLIEEIPNDAFRNIYNNKPQFITLRDNKIKTIFPDSFRGFKEFHTLNLAKNKLESWNENLLKHTEAIYYLNLSFNKIKCVDGEFDKIFKANITYLYENPLDSDCIEKIKSWASINQNKRVATQFY